MVETDDRTLLADAADMAVSALRYLESFKWFPDASAITWGTGVPGCFAVFQIRLTRPVEEDTELWVVVGDVPSAYLVVNEGEGAIDALRNYCDLMDDWCNAASEGRNLDEVFPVDAEPSPENVTLLRSRLEFIRNCEPDLVRTPSGKRASQTANRS